MFPVQIGIKNKTITNRLMAVFLSLKFPEVIMSFEAGSIFYTIKADTGALLIADKEVSSFNRSAQEGFEKTGASMSKLTSIAKAVSAALVSSTVLSYAQSWNELEDRIQNTGATASQTKDILDQLLATSDRNGRTIEESSELYIRLSNSMGELGYSTQSTLSYIDTLSNLLTINKTSSVGAESAMNALTKAQMKGKLSGVEAMTVFNSMPSILKTLANQLKKPLNRPQRLTKSPSNTCDNSLQTVNYQCRNSLMQLSLHKKKRRR